jgi:Uncharacterised nucleotidyltransferase
MTAPPSPLARAVAAFGLAGSTLSFPAGPLDERSWSALVGETHNQRLGGLLFAAVYSGGLVTTDVQRAQVTAEREQEAKFALLLEEQLLTASAALESADVDFRLLRGPSHAHLDYRDPSMRTYQDIDLLVPADHMTQALVVLAGCGYESRRQPLWRWGSTRRGGRAARLVRHGASWMDLQSTLVDGPAQPVAPAALFERPALLALHGRQLPVLSREARLLGACLRVTRLPSSRNLQALRDVAQILLSHELDLDEVERLCGSRRAEEAVANAVAVTWEFLEIADIIPMSVWARQYRQGRSERRRPGERRSLSSSTRRRQDSSR